MQLKAILPLALASFAAAQNMSITQALASQNSTLSTLNSLLAGQPALVKSLSSASSITLVALSNDAFSKILAVPANKAAASDPATLMGVLQYHVLSGNFPAKSFTNTQQFVPTLLTGSSSNTTMKTKRSNWRRAMNASSSSLSNVTGGQVVGAMTMGGKVMVMSGLKKMSTVQTADIMFDGGVIHIIDTVLTVPPPPSTTAQDMNLTSLATGLKSTNLLTAVDSLKDVTVFAPSNDAFKAVSSQTSSLTTQQLSTILQYHVINGTVGYSSLLTTGLANESFPTLSGGRVNILVEDNKVFVNSAQVIMTDVLTSNGDVHVIDNVLNPGNTTAMPVATAASQAPTFAGAASASNITGSATNSSSSTNTTMTGATSKAGAAKSIETGMGVAGMGIAALFGMVAVARDGCCCWAIIIFSRRVLDF